MTTRDVPEINLTRREAAKALKLGLSSIDELCKSGELPSAMIGRRRLIPAEAAREFMRRKTAEGQQSHKDSAPSGAVGVSACISDTRTTARERSTQEPRARRPLPGDRRTAGQRARPVPSG